MSDGVVFLPLDRYVQWTTDNIYLKASIDRIKPSLAMPPPPRSYCRGPTCAVLAECPGGCESPAAQTGYQHQASTSISPATATTAEKLHACAITQLGHVSRVTWLSREVSWRSAGGRLDPCSLGRIDC